MERRGEGEMYGKRNMETYITICKIDSQREFAVWLRKLKQWLCTNLEGWDGERGKEGEMYGNGNMETYITICNGNYIWNLLCGSGNSNMGFVSI